MLSVFHLLPQWPYLSFHTSKDNRVPSSPSHPVLSFEKTREEGREKGDGGEGWEERPFRVL